MAHVRERQKQWLPCRRHAPVDAAAAAAIGVSRRLPSAGRPPTGRSRTRAQADGRESLLCRCAELRHCHALDLGVRLNGTCDRRQRAACLDDVAGRCRLWQHRDRPASRRLRASPIAGLACNPCPQRAIATYSRAREHAHTKGRATSLRNVTLCRESRTVCLHWHEGIMHTDPL